MMKHEFEKAYGRKVSQDRWQEIERAYMKSNALDRIEFVAELKAEEAAKRFNKQAARADIEIERRDITFAQFRAYVRNRLKGTPFEGFRDLIEPNLGNGTLREGGKTENDGTDYRWCDSNGHFQNYTRSPNGMVENFIFDFDPYGGGKGFGYCYIRDDYLKQLAAN